MKLFEATSRRSVDLTLLSLAFLASFSVAQAQVKIGDNPSVINANAVLDIESTDKGLLLPRVALTATTNVAPLTAHVAGMAVYNTATAGDVTPGYYFNDGTKWVAIADAAEADRQLGTHDQTLTANRSVTLGSLDLNFDANTLVIDGSANRVGVGTAAPNDQLDVVGDATIRNALQVGTQEDIKPTLGGNWVSVSANGTFNGSLGPNFPNPDAGLLFTNKSTGGLLPWGMYTGLVKDQASTSPNNALRLDIGSTNALSTDGNSGADTVTPRMTVRYNGDVGIGTTTPAAKLDVSGNAIIGADLGAPSGLDNRLSFRRDDGGASGSLGYVPGSNQEFQFRNVSGGGFYTFITNNGGVSTEKMRITAQGRLGIGTETPDALLEVEKLTSVSNEALFSINTTGNRRLTIAAPDPANLNSPFVFETANSFDFRVDNNSALEINANGRTFVRFMDAGAGSDDVVTVNGAGELHRRSAAQVSQNIYNTDGALTANRAVTLGNLDLNFDANTLVIDGSANEVGVGTNNPASKLDVFGSMVIGNDSDDNTLNFRRSNGAVTGGIGYATGTNNDFQFSNGSGGGFFSFVPNSTTLSGAFAFRVNNNGSTTNAGGAVINESSFDQDFRVESDGNANMLVVDAGTNRVGIGTNAPNAALDVPAGAHLSTTRIQGNTIDLAQDATGDRNSILRFYSDADVSEEAAINREGGVDGNLVIDNEGNGITYVRNRGSGEVRLGTNNSDDLRILNGGGIRLANLPAAADNDLPVQANANGDLRKGYRAGEIIRTTIRTSFSTSVTLGGDQVDISTTYTPVLSNSTILVTYDCDYRMGGSGTDTWYSELFVSNLTSRVTQKGQYWRDNNGGGTRSSTLLPITGARTISSAAGFTIIVRLRDIGTSSDDEVVITPNNGIMTITEIAN